MHCSKFPSQIEMTFYNHFTKIQQIQQEQKLNQEQAYMINAITGCLAICITGSSIHTA